MQTDLKITHPTGRYAKCVETSRRIRWDIDKDVFRGREFDFSGHFLPDGLSMIGRLPFLGAADRRTLSQIQGRTYANIFGLVERFINAAVRFAPAMNYFVRTLEARKDMADLLVGVTGDFVPASEVLRMGYLLNLFRLSPLVRRPLTDA